MADEIKLKAPTVEQQVVVNINGEDKLKSFADTLDKISNNKNLQKYWKNQQDLINATADAYSNFQKKASKDNASELIKVTNALKAMSGTDLSHILPDFDKISKSMVEAQKIAGNIDSAFSVKGFKEAFDSFEALKAYGTDIQKLFSHFGVSSDIGELQQNVEMTVVNQEFVPFKTEKDRPDETAFEGYNYIATVQLKNTGKEEVKVDLTSLYIGTMGYSNGIDLEKYLEWNEDTRTLHPVLQSQETLEVNLVYELLTISWKKKDWPHVTEQPYYLQKINYPYLYKWKCSDL